MILKKSILEGYSNQLEIARCGQCLATIVFLFLAFDGKTQQRTDTTYWRSGGSSALTLSQVSLTNWAAGGQNSVAINANFSGFANRTKNRGKWENSLDLAYGLINQEESSGFSKSDDLINFVTKYSYKINKSNRKWFFTSLLDFRTQFDAGFATTAEIEQISDFMAPGYLTLGTGVSYDPTDQLSFSYQPLTGKFTFVLNQMLADEGAYGVDPVILAEDDSTILIPGKRSRAEFGSFFRAKYKNDIFESRLELFTGYTENRGEIDVNWQNSLIMKVTKVISINVFAHLIYDNDILIGRDNDNDGEIDEGTEKARVQFKSVLGVGLAYKFGAQKPK
ncbi:MAG: DUF3078 domain-containing protein [Bacteroidota bacterium]